MDDDGRGDEITGRTKLLNAVEMRQYDVEMRAKKAEDAIKRIKFWVQTALGITSAVAIGTFAIARWMGSVAHTNELESVSTRVTVVETKVDVMTKMLTLMTEQNREIARTVHAPMVVQPQELSPPQHPEAMKK